MAEDSHPRLKELPAPKEGPERIEPAHRLRGGPVPQHLRLLGRQRQVLCHSDNHADG